MKVKLSIEAKEEIINLPFPLTDGKSKEEILQIIYDEYLPAFLKLYNTIEVNLINE